MLNALLRSVFFVVGVVGDINDVVCICRTMYAFVKFTDGGRLIVPVSLIKQFRPRDDEDVNPKQILEAFWISEKGEEEGFYDATVEMLGGMYIRVIPLLRYHFQESPVRRFGRFLCELKRTCSRAAGHEQVRLT